MTMDLVVLVLDFNIEEPSPAMESVVVDSNIELEKDGVAVTTVSSC